jgi:hypothetical protein
MGLRGLFGHIYTIYSLKKHIYYLLWVFFDIWSNRLGTAFLSWVALDPVYVIIIMVYTIKISMASSGRDFWAIFVFTKRSSRVLACIEAKDKSIEKRSWLCRLVHYSGYRHSNKEMPVRICTQRVAFPTSCHIYPLHTGPTIWSFPS